MSGHRPWAEIREVWMPPEGTPERAAAEVRLETIKEGILQETTRMANEEAGRRASE